MHFATHDPRVQTTPGWYRDGVIADALLEWSGLRQPCVTPARHMSSQDQVTTDVPAMRAQCHLLCMARQSTWLWRRGEVTSCGVRGVGPPDRRLRCRDPNLLDTVAAYDDTVEFLRNIDLDSDALVKAVVGTIGDVDSYQLPDAKGRTAFMRHLLGVSDEERQQRRDEILATSNDDFRKFADVLEAVKGPEARVVAVTSKGAVDKAHEAQPGFFDKITTVL